MKSGTPAMWHPSFFPSDYTYICWVLAGFQNKVPDRLHASMFTQQNFDALTLSVTLTLIMSYK